MFYIPEKFYMGLSVPRISFRELGRASEEESRYWKNHYYLTAGFLATLYLKERIGLGLNYRTNNEMGAILTIFPNSRLQFGYSYQFGLNGYRQGQVNDGTHEISLGYRFGEGASSAKLL